jgi:hypothetical protein
VFTFATDATQEIEVVSIVDPAVQASEEAKTSYLKSRDESILSCTEGATRFVLRALTPPQREAAEVAAGVYRRSELGRQLWMQQPDEPTERARWQHALPEDEREALGSYEGYLSRVYREMLRGHDGDPVELLDSVRPEHHRQLLFQELVAHIQNISTLPLEGK